MSEIELRSMEGKDWSEVAELICLSLNYWSVANGRSAVFSGGGRATRLFCDEYEALDPGCCILADDTRTGCIVGSCFYHPRETHVSLGIMNAHPNYFGQGIARRLLDFITDLADREGKPVRLVSSAMNLDSFSLYTRAGFVPRQAFQDMILNVPEGGIDDEVLEASCVRDATLDDAPAIVELELDLVHIQREKDYRHFLENTSGIWRTLVYENNGGPDGFLVSVTHPGLTMIGPVVARTEDQALALLFHELNLHQGGCPLFLVPVDCDRMVQRLYRWGARNVEFHFHQVRGAYEPVHGVFMPTFMPETA